MSNNSTQKRTCPSSPHFFHPRPIFPTTSTNSSFIHRTHSRTSSRTPRPLSPFSQSTATSTTPTLQASPTITQRQQTPFRPIFRHLSSTPSSVSSIRSLSDSESSDDEIDEHLVIRSPVQILTADPEISDSEDQNNLPMLPPTPILVQRQSSITIEELPALPTSPMFNRHSSYTSTNSRLSWGHDSGIEILKGEYSSCAESSEEEITTDCHTDDEDEGDWDVDAISSSYPTDAFLLGGMGSLFCKDDSESIRQATPRLGSLRGAKGRKRSATTWAEEEESDGDDESDDASSKVGGAGRSVKRRMIIGAVSNNTGRFRSRVVVAEGMEIDG